MMIRRRLGTPMHPPTGTIWDEMPRTPEVQDTALKVPSQNHFTITKVKG